MAADLTPEIGARVKARRGQVNLTQDEVATAMRAHGFAWDRTTVAKVERGSRSLALDEALALCLVLDVGLVSLLPTRGQVEVTPTLTLSAKSVREALTSTEAEGLSKRRTTIRVDRTEEVVDVATVIGDLGPIAGEIERVLGHSPSAAMLADAVLAERGDAEQTAARRLDLSPLQVAALALALWERSLTDEREHRLATQVRRAAPDRGRRAVRGHITRELLAELSAARNSATDSDGAQ